MLRLVLVYVVCILLVSVFIRIVVFVGENFGEFSILGNFLKGLGNFLGECIFFGGNVNVVYGC